MSANLTKILKKEIDKRFPFQIQSTERLIKDSFGDAITDFDIELKSFIIEVTEGKGRGKDSQIKNKIQPYTKNKVILYGPNISINCKKKLKHSNITFFTSKNDLFEFLNKNIETKYEFF